MYAQMQRVGCPNLQKGESMFNDNTDLRMLKLPGRKPELNSGQAESNLLAILQQ